MKPSSPVAARKRKNQPVLPLKGKSVLWLRKSLVILAISRTTILGEGKHGRDRDEERTTNEPRTRSNVIFSLSKAK
jgi:hypothetical protein